MKIVRYCLFVFLLFYTSAGGWTQEWTDADPSNNLWSSPDNWLTGQVPILNDGWVGIDAGTPGPRVDSTLYDPQFETVGESWIRGVVIGDSGSGIGYMSMTSGTLKTGFPGDGSGGGAFGGVVIGYGDSTNPNCHGVLNMEGGLLISNWDFIVSGHGGGNGTVNMSGGEIHIHRLFVGWGGGTGTINLNNGLLLLPVEEGWGGDSRNGLLFLIYDTGKINITKGKIQLQGDRTKQVGEYIRTGKIEAYSGSGTVLVDFNKVNPGMTTVWACEGKPQTYCNPMDVKGADMQVTRFGDTYYYYATASQVYPNSTNGKGNPIFSSNNLMDWRFRGLTFDDDDDNIWGQYWFWGPEVYEKNGTYYLYSPCFRKINNADVGRICVSASSSPIGPFTEIKVPMFDWAISEDVIDLGGFVDEDGSIYTYFTATEAGTGNVIYAAKIAANMTDLATAPVKVIWPTQPWEKWITEGACVVKHEGIYYLAYSGDDFRQDYSIGYATSTSPLGPFTKYSGNPILTGSSEITKPGCPHFVWSPDHTELFMAYHSAMQLPARQFNLSRVHFEDSLGNPDIMVIENGSSKSPQPYPSGSRFTKTAVSDEFNSGYLDFDIWTTIWGQSRTNYDVSGGCLNLELADGCFWQNLADGQDLFLQRAPEGTWNITAKVTLDAQVNCEAAFLSVWQDHDNYMNLKTNYVNGKRFEVGVELSAVYNGTLVPNTIGNTVYLQVRKINENTYQCYYSANGTNWNKIGVDVNLPFHEVKVGVGGYLVYSGRDNVIAFFDYFRIEKTSLQTDFDHSETIDLKDFDALGNCWGLNNPVIKQIGDFNEDAHVNLTDLIEFVKEWLSEPSIVWSTERTEPQAKTFRGVIVQEGINGSPELLSVRPDLSTLNVKLLAYASQDGGINWTYKGVVAVDPDLNTDLGDTSLLLMNDGNILCSYRHNHYNGLPTEEKDFSIRVAISYDKGYTWQPHSIVAQHNGYDYGLWSNWLIQLSNGQIQCYYDDELTPFLDGTGAWHQFWVMKTLSGTSWINQVIVSKAHNPGDLSRDGCGQVVEISPGKLVSIVESVHTEMPRYGCVRMTYSNDYGATWSWVNKEREIIAGEPWYQAFAPCVIELPNETYFCAFMSDEHLGPDAPRVHGDVYCKNRYILGTQNGTDIDWESPSHIVSDERSYWPSGCMWNSNQLYIQYWRPLGISASKIGTID